MEKFILYLVRWQLSTPILTLVSFLLYKYLGDFSTAVIANLIGGCIFYKFDKWLFKRQNKNTFNENKSNYGKEQKREGGLHS